MGEDRHRKYCIPLASPKCSPLRSHPLPRLLISPTRLPLHPHLLPRPNLSLRHILHMHQLLHRQYLASNQRRVRVVHDLKTPVEPEGFERALFGAAEGDGGTREGDFVVSVRIWVGRRILA